MDRKFLMFISSLANKQNLIVLKDVESRLTPGPIKDEYIRFLESLGTLRKCRISDRKKIWR